jgi:hypothetical protein
VTAAGRPVRQLVISVVSLVTAAGRPVRQHGQLSNLLVGVVGGSVRLVGWLVGPGGQLAILVGWSVSESGWRSSRRDGRLKVDEHHSI